MDDVEDPGERHGAGPEQAPGATAPPAAGAGPDGGGDPHAGHEGHEGHEGHDHGDSGRCEEALTELYTFLDGELTDQRRIQIAHHLDDCSPCLEVYDFEAELRLVIRQRCQEQVPEALRQRVADRITSALSADGAGDMVIDGAAEPLDLADRPSAEADPGISA